MGMMLRYHYRGDEEAPHTAEELVELPGTTDEKPEPDEKPEKPAPRKRAAPRPKGKTYQDEDLI